MKSLPHELYESFKNAYGSILVVLGAFFSVFAWYIEFEQVIGVKFLLPAIVAVLLILFMLMDFSLRAYRSSFQVLPSVIGCRDVVIHGQDCLLLLLSKSEILGDNLVVSVFEKSNGVEIYRTWGRVLNVQSDGVAQVILSEYDGSGGGEFMNLIRNDGYMKSLIVRPSIPHDVFLYGEFRNGR